MNDRDALRRAIILYPAEDAPKLALADWYEEHGTPTERAWAGLMRHEHPPFAQITSRRNKWSSEWHKYARNLIPAGVMPKTFKLYMNLDHEPIAGRMEQERGDNPLSWPYQAGSWTSRDPHIPCRMRYGFLVGIAASARRLKGFLPRLVTVQPIYEAVQTCEFFEFAHMLWVDAMNDRYSRCIRRHTNHVPKEVFDRLTPGVWYCSRRDQSRTYPNLTAAREDLSRAWVSWAREVAGLKT